MEMQRRSQGRLYWEPLVQQLAAEGKPLTEFARQRGLSKHSLGWWRRKLLMMKSTEKSELPAGAAKFVALRLAASESPAIAVSSPARSILRLSATVSVEFEQLPSVAWLVELSEAIKGAR